MALGENHPDVCNGHHLEARTQMDLESQQVKSNSPFG